MSEPVSPADLTTHLRRWRGGDIAARDSVLPLVYRELRNMARARLRGERTDHTLDSVGLVHEAYLRLEAAGAVDWQDRMHFFAVASTAMRRVLLDHAKRRRREKRGGALVHVPLEPEMLGDAALAAESDPDALLALDEALTVLEQRHPRQARAVELRYFGGLTLEEVGEALGLSAPTAMRDLRFAQAWLADALRHEP